MHRNKNGRMDCDAPSVGTLHEPFEGQEGKLTRLCESHARPFLRMDDTRKWSQNYMGLPSIEATSWFQREV